MTILCNVMQVTRSGYYFWRKNHGASLRHMENTRILPLVRAIHKESRGTYGSRSISRALRSTNIPCGRRRAKTLMNLAGVSARQTKKFKITTDSKHNLPVAPNLLNRDFTVSAINTAWVSDITYVWTGQGWLYLAVIIDLFSRRVVGWSMSRKIDRKLVIDALMMGVGRRQPSSGLIFHSDRGSQYCSEDFQKRLKSYGIKCSMSRKGDCWDNAVAESFFGTLKIEQIYSRYYCSREEAKRDIVDYIEMFYNSKRRHSFIGYVSPIEFEKMQRLKKSA